MGILFHKKRLGKIGEGIAAKFLMKRGFSIVTKNYTKKWGEIDVIAEINKKIHFVEVKTVSCENIDFISRETDDYRPEDNVHPQKLQRLGRTIQSYLLEKCPEDQDWQFDVIAVFFEAGRHRAKVRLIEDVVL